MAWETLAREWSDLGGEGFFILKDGNEDGKVD